MEQEITASSTDHESEPLCYSDVAKAWLSPSLLRLHNNLCLEVAQAAAVLPTEILEWLKRRTEIEHWFFPYRDFRNHYLAQPWSTAPSSSQLKGIAQVPTIMTVGKKLQYDWNNLMLPLEALTHASFTEAITPSCERYALQGKPLTEMIMMELLMENMSFLPEASRDLGTTSKTKGMTSQNFTLAWWPDEEKAWPSISWQSTGSDAAITKATTLLEWLSACCNHIAYAYCCVRLDLHK